ncbi:MAG: aldo/keto reductase [Acidimicrobiia bacterium]|nr:aldo/keto reductase [Acidimicrobiia bacterium]
MEYRRLGSAGLKVSVLSFGSWVTFDNQLDTDLALDCMQAAHDAGVNFFDNAEAYAGGESERIMGDAIARLGWPRHSYVVSTKFFFGIHDGPNSRQTLNRKYLLEAVDQSLERFGLDVLDLVFCHRPDPDTPIEETVWAMHDIIDSGRAYYWGTSEWSAEQYSEAWAIADRRNLHKPQMEQPQYNLLNRDRVETEYVPLYAECGMGTTIWSPLASGVLTGKYLDGVPDDSRGALAGYEWLRDAVITAEANAKVTALIPIAEDLGCSLAQLAIAWCAKNPNVSSVITGASRASQVTENMAALEVLARLDDEVMNRIEAAVA